MCKVQTACSISEEACNQCFPLASIHDGQCVCKDGYYDSSKEAGLVCQPCDSSCKTCWGASSYHCTLCKDPFATAGYLYPCKCLPGFYMSASQTCTSCLDDCLTCSDGQSCDSCRDSNAEVKGGQCVCKENLKTLSTNPLMCSHCPQGTYYEGGQCAQCYDDCLTCSQMPICLTCKKLGYIPYDKGGCIPSSCPTGTYLINKSCEACHFLCLTCSGFLDNCLNCVKFASIQPNGNCKCNSGYEVSNFSCLKTSGKINFVLIAVSSEQLEVRFTQELPHDLDKADLKLLIEGAEVDFSIEKKNETIYLLTIAPSQGKATVQLNSPLSLLLGSDMWFVRFSASVQIMDETQDSERTWLDDVTYWTPVGLKALIGVMVVLQWIYGGFAYHLIGLLQLLAYVPYMDLALPSDLRDFLKSLNLYNCIPNLLLIYLHQPNSFLVKSGGWITILCSGLVIWMLSSMLKSNLRSKRIAPLLKRICSYFRWDFFSRLALVSTLDISFYALTQLKRFNFASGLEAADSLAASFGMVKPT